ncbi:MAG: hypothetical protein B7Y39_18020 [Bdellovibrio sp. 28-41-41]|nr:MAG: hypothetical protein B7Y39_18020 [Bdellovibrio sp. 28-41-41]
MNAISLHRWSSFWCALILSQLISFSILAKTPAYINNEDAALKIKTVYLEPFSDNVNLIYASKAEAKIKDIIENNNQWEITVGKKDADLVIESRLTKNPKSYTLKMGFLFKSGIVIQDSKEIDNIFETEKILGHYEVLFHNLKSRIPFHGIILSRTQDQVTINIGAAHGVVPNQEVIAIHIVKLNLHPKTQAYISSEKIVLGKIVLTKVDEFLSFGKIEFERDKLSSTHGTNRTRRTSRSTRRVGSKKTTTVRKILDLGWFDSVLTKYKFPNGRKQNSIAVADSNDQGLSRTMAKPRVPLRAVHQTIVI